MASVSAPTKPHKLNLTSPKLSSSFRRKGSPYPSSPSSVSCPWLSSTALDSTLCRCVNPSSDSSSPDDNLANSRWDSLLREVVAKAVKTFDSYVSYWINQSPNGEQSAAAAQNRDREKDAIAKAAEVGDGDWDWERWRKHFDEVDEQERLVSVLKSQLDRAIYKEDFEDASRLKVAIAAAANNDTVGRVVSCFHKAVDGEQYMDAAFLRDKAGAGLVGWWAGIPQNVSDPRGLIIRITPEHGRYVARCYSPWQLATSAAGVPLFEIFLTVNRQGEYTLQAVYLKRKQGIPDHPTISNKSLGAPEKLSPLDSPGDRSDFFVVDTDDFEGVDNEDCISDPAEGLPGFQNMLTDMIPGMKVRVLKVTTPEKFDKDMMSDVTEQEQDIDNDDEDDDDDNGDENEDEEEDKEENSADEDDEIAGVVEVNIEMKDLDLEALEIGSEQEKDGKMEKNDDYGTPEGEERKKIALEVVLESLVNRLSGNVSSKELIRVPAELERKGYVSFSFSVKEDANEKDSRGKERPSLDKSSKIRSQKSAHHVMFDLAKFVGKEKVPLKVLKDVGKLINLTIDKAKHQQPLSGSTVFNRIQIPVSSDPLNGLYVGAHGFHSSEVIQLRRRIGQWQEENGMKNPSDLEFYEYVEALKLTGDPYVPAGQVAFRAKVGKRYQLPHKGIIPEEFGVIARYKGQGRLAEPGFRNPRWVDGELVILDGKYINGGPVVGFVYWAPEFHFLVFFNRLRLQE